jgi:DNA-binding NarL/FixJ family response regulator
LGYVIRVLLVDDQELMRVGFRMVLGAQDDMEIVGEAGNGEEAVRLAEELRPCGSRRSCARTSC